MKLRDIIERSRDFLDLSGDNTNKSQLVLNRVMKKKTETWKLQKMIFFLFYEIYGNFLKKTLLVARLNNAKILSYSFLIKSKI